MKEVLETAAEADAPQHRVRCLDDSPVLLLKEMRVSIAATKPQVKRVDDEYKRNGTSGIFLFAEHLSGCRPATASQRRTKTDWAVEVAQLLETRHADGEQVTIVLDNLNTHTTGEFKVAFKPDRVRAYRKRIEFCDTPKHGRLLRKGRSTRRSHPNKRVRTSGESSSATPRNTAVG